MPASTDSCVTVLDHIDSITVPGDVFQEPFNEYWALICLRDGMEFIYQQVRHCDEVARQLVNPGGNAHFFGTGSFPAFDKLPESFSHVPFIGTRYQHANT